eukprot:GHVS01080486.1.p1 GENE.GHVS01080486.1~~GHVS01080486.1.p1  ORF type:complete len:791 (-),score=77.68 GHVS01080486.1:258-2630(-)
MDSGPSDHDEISVDVVHGPYVASSSTGVGSETDRASKPFPVMRMATENGCFLPDSIRHRCSSSISSSASFAPPHSNPTFSWSLFIAWLSRLLPAGDSPAAHQPTPCGINRYVLLVIYVLYVFATGSVYFGWPALSSMLFMQDAYIWLCPDDAALTNNRFKCSDQDTEVQRLFQIAMPVHFTTSAVAGSLMDRMGPKFTGTIGQSLNCLAWVLLSQSSQSAQTYIPAFILIGLGADTGFLPTLTISNLFPGSEGLVIAVMSAANSASFAIPLILLEGMTAGGGKEAFEKTCLLYAGTGVGLCFLVALILLPGQPFISDLHLTEQDRDSEAGEQQSVPEILLWSTPTCVRFPVQTGSFQTGTALDLAKIRATPDYRKRTSMSFRAMADLNLGFAKSPEPSRCGPRHHTMGPDRRDLWGYHCWHYDVHHRPQRQLSRINRDGIGERVGGWKRRRTTAGLHLGSVQGEEGCEIQRHRGVVSHELLSSVVDGLDNNRKDSASVGIRSLATSALGSGVTIDEDITGAWGLRRADDGLAIDVAMSAGASETMHPFDDVLDKDCDGSGEEDLVVYAPVSFKRHVLSVDYLCIVLYFMLTSIALSFWIVSIPRLHGDKVNAFYGNISPLSFVFCLIHGKLVDCAGILWVLAGNTLAGVLCFMLSLVPGAPAPGYVAAVAMVIYVSFYTNQLYCFLEWRFDVLYFGKLAGIASAAGGLFSLLAQPLYGPLSKHLLHGNFRVVGSTMLTALVFNEFFVVALWWINRRNETKYSPLQKMDPGSTKKASEICSLSVDIVTSCV